MVNSKARDALPRMKWEQIILVLAIGLLIIGLGVVSIVSFFQTETAFRNLNDSEIKGVGSLISVAFAFIFQYGQNAALYIRKKFCNGKIIYSLYTWEVSDKTIFLGIFWLFAAVDALTNIVWFYKTVEINPDPFLNAIVRVLGYAAMILAVGVEEALGKALDAFSHALSELKVIFELEVRTKKSEMKAREREEKTYAYESEMDYPAENILPPHKGKPGRPSSVPSVIKRPQPNQAMKGSFPGDELGASVAEVMNAFEREK
jgi:hypothetical protein